MWVAVLTAAAGIAVGPVSAALGQDRSASIIVADSVRAVGQPDSLAVEADAVVDSLRGQGYLYARVDTVEVDSVSGVARITRGPQAELGEIELVGVSEAHKEAISLSADLRPGDAFGPEVLEREVGRILSYYEREGRFLASIAVERLELLDGPLPRFEITLRIDEGPRLRLKRIELIGGGRTNPSLVGRVTGLRAGEPIEHYDPELVRRSLVDVGFFEDVGDPTIFIESDSGAVLRIPIEEGDPGSFDLVLGYLPSQVANERGSIVGSGHLELRNVFGGGRTLAVRLHRLPGQASSIDVGLSNPFLFGLPLGVSGSFHGLEQDSTYGKQDYGGEINYYVASGVDLVGSFSREITSPGQEGVRLGADGRQLVSNAEAWFLGLGVSVRRVDRLRNPTRGLFVEMNLETGRKVRSERRVVGTDTTRRSSGLEQKRLQAGARAYLPTFRRQVLVFGADTGLLISSEYDRSDLFRFGGATSLRGYDEDRFLGRTVARGLVEYRLLIDRLSFAYGFFDLGYVDRPLTPELDATSAFHPGYGIGIQFETAVGLVNVSAALNPEGGPTEARIHAGLSFGL